MHVKSHIKIPESGKRIRFTTLLQSLLGVGACVRITSDDGVDAQSSSVVSYISNINVSVLNERVFRLTVTRNTQESGIFEGLHSKFSF